MNRQAVARELVEIAGLLTSAEGDACGEKGCIRKVKGGYAIMSGKTGEFWRGHGKGDKPGKINVYKDKATAEKVLKRYHGWGF